MSPAAELRASRRRAGLTQAALANRAGTSQAAVAAYETGAREPSLATFQRLLAAAGARLEVVADGGPPGPARRRDLARAGRTLEEVLALAEALPTRHATALRYPRLPAG